MTKLMILIGSVRPGRVGLPVAQWVESVVSTDSRFEVDVADLAEIRLPLMDEPAHPRLGQYSHDHTFAWSARVTSADAFIFVTPEYNYSFAPALKNALDYLHFEWRRKPVGIVSYGGASSGTRGVVALRPVLSALGLVGTGANVEISHIGRQINEDGEFVPTEQQEAVLAVQLTELIELDGALSTIR